MPHSINSRTTTKNPHLLHSNSIFSREIGFALAVKCFLLALLWWLFFRDTKQAVTGNLVADKLFGSAFSVVSSPARSKLNDR